MRVIVAGGTGLIGSVFVERLAQRGDQVWVLSRTAPAKYTAPRGVEVVQWDARTPAGWGELVEQADAVVNLAGENLGAGRWTWQRKQRFITSRVQAGQAVTTALRQASRKPGVVLQASAVGYYGPQDERMVDENSPAGNDFLARVGVAWEDATREVEAFGVRRVIIRTGLVTTRSAGFMQPLLLQFGLFAGGPLGRGKQYWPWIALEDQLGAMLFLLDRPEARGAFNLTAPEPVTMGEFGRTLAKVLGRPYWLPVPAFALRLLLGEMSTLVLDGQRAVPMRLLELGFQFRQPDLRLALEATLR